MLGPKRSVLVIDDDPELLELMRVFLEADGFEVSTAERGDEGVRLAFTEPPDIVLVDRNMPEMSGLEVIERLRGHLMTRNLPILLVTTAGSVGERVSGLKSGADDYIVKPFDPDELGARVHAAIRRSARDLGADPLTKLPGNRAIRDEVEARLRADETFLLGYADLSHFKAYVDHCGFERAGEVIQWVGKLLYNSVVDLGAPDDTLGHIGGDDFILLLRKSHAAALSDHIIGQFSEHAPTFYDQETRERGFIEGIDRYGTQRKFPFVGLALAVVLVEPGDFSEAAALGHFASRCKDDVKRSGDTLWRLFRADASSGSDGALGLRVLERGVLTQD